MAPKWFNSLDTNAKNSSSHVLRLHTKLIAKCQICNVDHDLAVVMKEEGLQAFQSGIKNSFLFQLRILSVILRVGSFYSNWHFWHWHWKFRAKRTVCQGREKFKIIEIQYFLLKFRKFQNEIWSRRIHQIFALVFWKI